MATVVNDRDKALQSVSPRLIATSVAISGTAASFLKQKNGGAILPSSITLTAVTTVFTSPTYVWEYALSNAPTTWISLGGGVTQTITGSSFVAAIGTSTHIQYRVSVTQTGFLSASNTFLISYSSEADEGIIPHITRTSATANYDSTGTTPTLVGGLLPNTGTVISVTRGSTDLTYNATTGANTFYISSTTTTGGSIGYYASPVGSGTTYTVSDITSMSASSITVVYTITCRDASGNVISPSLNVQITYTKLLAAASGSSYSFSINPTVGYIGIDSAGNPSDFTSARTDYTVMYGATDDTSNWTYTKTDYNCTSTLTGSHLQVDTYGGATVSLAFNPATTGSGINLPALGTNEAYGNVAYGKGIYLVSKFNSSSPWTVSAIAISTDKGATWSDSTLPTMYMGGSPYTINCAYGSSMDKFVALGAYGAGYSTMTAYSTDAVTWTTGGALPGINDWYGVKYGGGKFIAYMYSSSTAFAYSTNGTSWSTGSFGTFSPAALSLAYGNGVWVGSSLGNGFGTWRSTDGGSTWNQVLTYATNNIGTIYFAGGVFLMWCTTAMLKVSVDGASWTAVPSLGFIPNSCFYFNGVIWAITNGAQFYSTNGGLTWGYTTSRPAGSATVFNLSGTIDGSTSFALPYTYASGTPHGEAHIVTPSFPTPNVCYVDIVAHKALQPDAPPKRFLLTKGTLGVENITSYAVPGAWVAPSTSDGVVTSYATSSMVCRVLKNGIDDSAAWTFAITADSGITLGSSSGQTVSITNLTTGFTTGNVYVAATKTGYLTQNFTIPISKSYGNTSSGPIIGATFNAMTTAASGTAYIALRFKSDGTFQVAHSSGAWVLAGQWAGAVVTGIGSSWWIKVDATGSALDSGTTGSWLSLSSDRDYVLSQTGTGTKGTTLAVYIGSTSTGGSVTQGSGILQVGVA